MVELGQYGIPEIKYDAKKHTSSKNLTLVTQTMSRESRSELKLLIPDKSCVTYSEGKSLHAGSNLFPIRLLVRTK